MAPANAFVLVEWCSVFLQHLSGDLQDTSDLALQTISAHAKALETCLKLTAKQGLRHSSIIVTRRALRAVLSPQPHGEELLRESILKLTSEEASGSKVAPFLGEIAGVSSRIAHVRPIMNELKTKVFQFYAKEIIGSRTIVPGHIANGLHDLFVAFATEEDLEGEVWPPLEKAILRNPEIVFTGLIPPLSSAIPEEVDVSEVFASRLAKPILASIKSANIAIRNGSVEAFKNLVFRCKDQKHLLMVAGEVVAPLKALKTTNAEQRALQAQTLLSIPCFVDLSQAVVAGLSPVFARESSEVALEFEAKAFCHHLAYLLQAHAPTPKDQLMVVVKGCEDKRISFRKCWAINFGELLWNTDNVSLVSSPNFIRECLKPVVTKLKADFDEISANPLPSVQSGAIPIAFVLTALSTQTIRELPGEETTPLLSSGEIIRQSLTLSPKPSFLLNPKVYTKLASNEDMSWAIRALSVVSKESLFETADPTAKIAWAQAFVYVICSSSAPPKVPEKRADALSQCYFHNPASVGPTVIKSIWHWLWALDVADRDSAAVCSGTASGRLHMVVRAITPDKSSSHRIDSHALKSQLVNLLVLCRPEMIPGSNWIDVVLKTGVDPGELVQEYPDACMNQVFCSSEVSLSLVPSS